MRKAMMKLRWLSFQRNILFSPFLLGALLMVLPLTLQAMSSPPPIPTPPPDPTLGGDTSESVFSLGQPFLKIAPFEYSDNQLTEGETTHVYRVWFENGAWQGDLIQYSLDIDAEQALTLTTSVDLSGLSPTNESNADNWSAHERMMRVSKRRANWWRDSRKVLMFDEAGQQVPFRYDSLSEARQTFLTEDIVNYIRGDRSKELDDGTPDDPGTMRKRYSLLGAIINSNPSYVGPPSENYADESYLRFLNNKKNRKPQIIVGANDGMVHVFNAETGDEIFAYVPSAVLPNLPWYTTTDYYLNYYADGGITVRDVKIGNRWKTVAVGGLGAGGTGLWALDLTSANMGEEISTKTNHQKLLWETPLSKNIEQLAASEAPASVEGSSNPLGHIYERPSIVQLKDSNDETGFYIVHGNGAFSGDEKGRFYIRDIEDGAVVDEVENAESLGFYAPALVDASGDGIANYAYAGDQTGGIWRFTIEPGPKITSSLKLMQLPANAPENHYVSMTSPPQIARHPISGFMVIGVTGKAHGYLDVQWQMPNYIFGLWDKAPWTVEDYQLAAIDDLVTQTHVDLGDENYQSLSKNNVNYSSGARGWAVPLEVGLQGLTTPTLRTGRLKVTLTYPSSIPLLEGDIAITEELFDTTKQKNWDYELNYLTGGRLDTPIFDKNDDGKFTSSDMFKVGDQSIAPMIKYQGFGLRSEPTSIRLPEVEGHTADLILHNVLTLASPVVMNCDTNPELAECQPCAVDPTLPECHPCRLDPTLDQCFTTVTTETTTCEDSNLDESEGCRQTCETHPHLPHCNPVTGGLLNGHFDVDNYRDEPDGDLAKHEHEYDDDEGVSYFDAVNTPNSSLSWDDIDDDQHYLAVIANADLSPGAYFMLREDTYSAVRYQKSVHKKLERWGGEANRLKLGGKSLVFKGSELKCDDCRLGFGFDLDALTAGGLLGGSPGCYNKDWGPLNGRYRNGAILLNVIKLIKRPDGTFINPYTANHLVRQTPTDLVASVRSSLDPSRIINLIQNNGNTYGGLVSAFDPSPQFAYGVIVYHHDEGECYGSSSWRFEPYLPAGVGPGNGGPGNTVTTTTTTRVPIEPPPLEERPTVQPPVLSSSSLINLPKQVQGGLPTDKAFKKSRVTPPALGRETWTDSFNE